LLDLLVLIRNIGLLLDLINGLLGLVGVLLDEVNNGGDGSAVLGVLLGLLDGLIVSYALALLVCHSSPAGDG
jgi:hypothetical protein